MKKIPLKKENRDKQKKIREKVAGGGPLASLMNGVRGHSSEKETVEIMGDIIFIPPEEEEEKQVPLPSIFRGIMPGVMISPKFLKSGADLLKKIYFVVEGDTLGSIAKKFGTTVAKLRELNGLTGKQPLRTGQKIKLR